MKTRKIAVILIAVIFFIALIICIGAIFTVKKVDTVFAVSEGTKLDIDKARQSLDEYVGKNLLFLDTDSIKEVLEEDSYLEVISVKKDFPNVVKVEVKERKEVYLTEFNGDRYALNEDGLVLSKIEGEVNERNYVLLNLENIQIITAEIGCEILTDAPELLDVTFEIAKNLRLTDCIKTATITNVTERQELRLKTYTAVDIVISSVLDDGVSKAKKALEVYDGETKDYIKTYNEIISYKKDTGEIVAVWTKHGA